MNLKRLSFILGSVFITSSAVAGIEPTYASGKITSLLASASDPAIRLTGNISPDQCDGGTHGWLYFQGAAEERNRVYGSALALSLAGKSVTVYTNSDGTRCRISNIQVTSGLN